MVSRAVLMSIDDTERRAAYFLAGIGGALAIFLAVFATFEFSPTSILSAAKSKADTCPTGYTSFSSTTCHEVVHNTRGGAWLLVAISAMCAFAIWFFARKRSRPGTIFFAVFTGLATFSVVSVVAYPFLFVGGWILWRAWRLHKYGVPTFAGVSAINRERVAARKEGRPAPVLTPAVVEPPAPKPPRTRTRAKAKSGTELEAEPAGVTRKPAEASKRYTPKKQPRARTR
jgi:hypothetical protein